METTGSLKAFESDSEAVLQVAVPRICPARGMPPYPVIRESLYCRSVSLVMIGVQCDICCFRNVVVGYRDPTPDLGGTSMFSG